MSRIYDKSTKELVKEFVKTFIPSPAKGFFKERKLLSEGGHFTRKEIIVWFKDNYPKIKQGTINAHLLLMSTNAPSRIHHSLRPNGADDLLFQLDRNNFRLYNKETDPASIYKTNEDGVDDEDDEDTNTHEFAYENDLKNYLSKNLNVIDNSLSLYVDGDITGIEFPVGGKFIDILAVDKQNNLVIIELKVSKGYDKVIGQILRYIAWIEKNLASSKQRVRGIIIASHISEDLKLATSKIKDVTLYEYELSLKLKKI